MPTPRTINFKGIFAKVDTELALDGSPAMTDENKRDARQHIEKTLAHIDTVPALQHHHAQLSDDDVAEVLFTYALAIARGKGIDRDGETLDVNYLSKKLTTKPLAMAEEEVPLTPAEPPEPLEPTSARPPAPVYAHLLDNPRNVNILHGELDKASKRPGPEQVFASILAKQMKTADGRADVVRLYKALDVMTNVDDPKKVSDFAYDGAAIGQLWKAMSPAQRGMLLDAVMTDDRWRINPKRWLNPHSKGGMTRRVATATIVATFLGFDAFARHDDAHKQSDAAIGVQDTPKKKPEAPNKKPEAQQEPKQKDEDFFGDDPRKKTDKPGKKENKREAQPDDADFFGADPRQNLAKEETKEKLQAAIVQDRVAIAEAIGATVAGAFGLVHLGRRMFVPLLPSTNAKISEAVHAADGPNYRAKEAIRAADRDEHDGRTG